MHLQLNWYPLSGSNYAPNPCFRPPERVWDRPNSPAWGGLDLHPSRLGMKGAQMGEVRSAALRRLMLPHMARRVARTGAVLGGNDAELNDLVAALESEDEERAAATERHDKKPAAMQFAWPMLASCLLLRVRSIPADQYATKRRFSACSSRISRQSRPECSISRQHPVQIRACGAKWRPNSTVRPPQATYFYFAAHTAALATVHLQELSEHTLDGSGDIRYPDWDKVLAPLCEAGEVYRCFVAERVRSELLGDVRLAARSRVNSGHVTALVRADARSFRHYDNDSDARQRGTFAPLSLRAAWGPFILFAVVREGSPLQMAIDQLQPQQEHVDLSSPPRRR